MSIIKKLISGLFLFTWVTTFLGLWASPVAGQTADRLKVGYIPIAACLPLYAAIENGYFEQEGLKLELVPMAGGGAIIPAMVGGSLDIGFSAYFSIVLAKEENIDVQIIAPSNKEVGTGEPYVAILVGADSGIAKAKDLEGKTFAIGLLKSVDWVTTAEWMSKHGADHKKVKWVEIPFPNMGAALRAKKIDAMTGVDPFLTLELARGGVKIIGHPFFEVSPNFPIAGFVATEVWIKKNRSLAERFVRALNKGTDFINNRPEKRGEILVKFTKTSPDLAAKLKFYPGFDRFVDSKGLQTILDLAVKYGMVSKRLDIKSLALPGVLK